MRIEPAERVGVMRGNIMGYEVSSRSCSRPLVSAQCL